MGQVYIPVPLRRLVFQRAKEQCEYCLLHVDDVPFNHQVDHFIALKHGGQTTADNLILACLECNRYKGSDLVTLDPITGEITPIFNPRQQIWKEHFALEGAQIIAKTPIGRATIALLRLNNPKRVIQRQVLIQVKRYPPLV